jgi:hypothetical protein
MGCSEEEVVSMLQKSFLESTKEFAQMAENELNPLQRNDG